MASWKMTFARVEACPPPDEVREAMEEHGCPENEEFGVLNPATTSQGIFATVIRRTRQAVPALDTEAGEVVTQAVEKVVAMPLAIFPDRSRMELYAGPASAPETVGQFLASSLALPAVVHPIELEIPSAVEKLRAEAQRFQLRSVRVSEYAHSSYMSGPYTPKFLDTEHGMDFLQQYAEFVTSASVRFQGPAGMVTVHLTPKAAFRYTAAGEDDSAAIQAMLRRLI